MTFLKNRIHTKGCLLALTLLPLACGKQAENAEQAQTQQVQESQRPKLKVTFPEVIAETTHISARTALRCEADIALFNYKNVPPHRQMDLLQGALSKSVTAGDDIDSKIPNPFPTKLVNTYPTSCVVLGYVDYQTRLYECTYNPATMAIKPNIVKLRFLSQASKPQVGVGTIKKSYWVVPAQIEEKGHITAARCKLK